MSVLTTPFRITFCLLLAAFALTGCVPENDEDSDAKWKTEEQTLDPDLEASFISGHLGNYWDCPEDGYSETSSEPSAGAPPMGDMAPCEEGEDCGTDGYMLNCEDAQAMVLLSNSGEELARDLQVTTIELFDSHGVSRAVLPLIDITDTTSLATFDGELAVDEERRLRIDFQGPAYPYELLTDAQEDGRWGYAGTLEITFTSANHDDVIVITTELYPVPSMAT